MAVRAMWKGVLVLGSVRVPVKLYSALQDRAVRFRLLHRDSGAPVVGKLVRPETDTVVPFDETRRGFVSDDDQLVVLDPEELSELEPEASRDVSVRAFVPEGSLDRRLYDRPYYLGPDGDVGAYMALAHVLRERGREGIAHWTMRKKEYTGALVTYRGYPMLISLRSAERVLPLDAVAVARSGSLDAKQQKMAQQLVGMMEAPFRPEEYRDEYRERVLELVESKARGARVELPKPQRRRRRVDLDRALEASLRAARG
jgi:DNA end-binding protein Ku